MTALTGCATAAQQQMANINQTMQQASAELTECITANYNSPEIDPIKPYIPSPENNFMPTMKQLSVDRIPTKEESKILLQFFDSNMPCRTEFMNKASGVAPAYTTAILEVAAKTDAIMMQLVKRKITWGKGEQQIQEKSLEGQKKLIAVGQQMDANFLAAHQSEINQRQAFSSALGRTMSDLDQNLKNRSQPIVYAPQPNTPVTTSCRRNTWGVNCTSW